MLGVFVYRRTQFLCSPNYNFYTAFPRFLKERTFRVSMVTESTEPTGISVVCSTDFHLTKFENVFCSHN